MRAALLRTLIWVLSCLAVYGLIEGFRPREITTVSRLSPDETIRASLIERVMPPLVPRIDRNFLVRLEDLRTRSTIDLFRSPDEGVPAGTERLIWSKDGKKLLIVGRHFLVYDDLFLDNGDQAYFLHDRSTGQSWYNWHSRDDLPRLTAEIIQGIAFTEPVILKPR